MAKVKPFIIGTRNAGEFLYAGAKVLRDGGSAIDAVEASTKLVEANPKDDSVGYGGVPNLLGKVELVASIMDGIPAAGCGCRYTGNGVPGTGDLYFRLLYSYFLGHNITSYFLLTRMKSIVCWK